MAKADRVYITPPTNTPVDTTRRRFFAVAAFASIAGAGSLAFAATAPNDVPHAVIIPRHSRPDPVFALIADKLAGDIAHCDAIDWKLVTTPPTTLAGVAAVLRFANEHEDAGGEWPNTDAVGPDGWHYQLRATMTAAIEALIKVPAGKAVLS